MMDSWPMKLRKLKAVEALCATKELEISNEVRYDIIDMIWRIREVTTSSELPSTTGKLPKGCG